jgi:haloacetate dehalogenase
MFFIAPSRIHWRRISSRMSTGFSGCPKGGLLTQSLTRHTRRSRPEQPEESVERRTFLAAASVGSVVGGPLARLANAQRDSSSAVTSSGSASFNTAEIDVAGNKVFYRRYGQGPAILMVHGFPRTSLMWRFLAPKLAGNHTVVCVDLRGYGRSGIPASADDHYPYSKRAMAKELVDAMVKLGFPTFTLIGHDRGGRVVRDQDNRGEIRDL